MPTPRLATGRLDRWITLQRATESQDPITNQALLDWDQDERIAAEWLPATTREAVQAQQRIGSYIEGVYQIHFREDVTPEASRIIGHDGRIYDVKPPIEVGRRAGLLVPVVAHGEAP